MKFWLCFLTLVFPIAFPMAVFGQAAKPKQSFRAQIKHSEAHVFKEPNFDSDVLAVLSEGKIYPVSRQKVNKAFYRIRIRPGLVGYISDADVKPLFSLPSQKPPPKSGSRIDAEKMPEKNKRSFQYIQYVGGQYSLINFKEDTMGVQRQDRRSFFGLKLSGPDLVVEGAFQTDVNFQFSNGAPSYYESLTGNSADGWIMLMDFRWQTYSPLGRDVLTFLGFGPMLRYSKFNVSLTDAVTGRSTSYSLEDIAMGAVFNLGGALRLGSIALRGEFQYYWEKLQYLGGGLSLQFAF